MKRPLLRRVVIAACGIALGALAPIACSSAHGTDGGFESEPDASSGDGASKLDAKTNPTDADLDAGSALLATSPNCPLSLFEPGTSPIDFSTDAAIAANWTTSWVSPTPSAGGSLQFGPHPMSENWWENYSPITSLNRPGDVLVCARLRVSPDLDMEADSGATVDGGGDSTAAGSNTFEVTVRLPDDAGFETAGMALQLQANASQIVLHTRTSADTWVTHDTAAFTLSTSTISTVDVVLFAQGSHFFAEARNVDTGGIAILHAEYNLPAGGAVSLVGWRERGPTFVDRIVMGVPAASTLPALQ